MDINDVIKKKVEEIVFAQYSGDIKGIVTIIIDKNNEIRLIEGFDSNTHINIYMGISIVLRRIEQIIMLSAKITPFKE